MTGSSGVVAKAADESGCHRERGHGGNYILLQLAQFGGRPSDNARKSNVACSGCSNSLNASNFKPVTLAPAKTFPAAA